MTISRANMSKQLESRPMKKAKTPKPQNKKNKYASGGKVSAPAMKKRKGKA